MRRSFAAAASSSSSSQGAGMRREDRGGDAESRRHGHMVMPLVDATVGKRASPHAYPWRARAKVEGQVDRDSKERGNATTTTTVRSVTRNPQLS
jgi:hypothetical protein